MDELIVRALLRLPNQQGQSKDIEATVLQHADLRARLGPPDGPLFLLAPGYEFVTRWASSARGRLASK